MNNLFENSRINLKPSADWNKWLSTSFQPGRCECHRCQDNSYDESLYGQRHTFVINGQVMARKFTISAVDDLKGKLKNAWSSYYDHGEEAQADKPDVSYQQANIRMDVERVKVFTKPENQLYLDILLASIEGVSVENGDLVFNG